MSNGALEYAEAIAALRRIYLAERLDGEDCAAWLARTGRDKGVLGG